LRRVVSPASGYLYPGANGDAPSETPRYAVTAEADITPGAVRKIYETSS